MRREGPEPAILRRIEPRDVLACVDVFYTAVDALYEDLNRPSTPRDATALTRLLDHLIRHDGERAWLAEAPSASADPREPEVLGFGAATLRDADWYLSLLFVRPHAQRGGLGRRLLLRTFPGSDEAGRAVAGTGPDAATDHGHNGRGGGPDSNGDADAVLPSAATLAGPDASASKGTLSTCVDSIQPISTGLYARYGIVPRVPLFTLIGRADGSVFPPLPRDVLATAFGALPTTVDLPATLASVDRAVVGHARPADHEFWANERRSGVLFRRAGTGEALGYGYTQASGRLGPVAMLDELLLTPAIGELVAREQPPGPWLALVPGSNDRATVALLRAGLRYEGFPGILASTRPFPGLERYLPASFGLL